MTPQDLTLETECALAAATLMEQIKEARLSPLGLYKLLFTTDEGKPIYITWFHKEWNDLIMQHRTIMIEASRGVTKTSFVALASVLWIIGRNPNIRVKLITETEENAKKRLSFIHGVIDHSDLYKMVFPRVAKNADPKKPNTTTAITLERDIDATEATIEGAGVLSAGTGGRADLLVLDDVVGASNSLTNPAKIPLVKDKLKSDWLPTLTPNGRIWCIFTPWATQDANVYFKKHAGWEYRKYAHGKEGDPYHSIFPELWPRERLIERRRWAGPVMYALGYLCQLVSTGVSPVLPKHLRAYTHHELTEDDLNRAIAVLSIDPASGKNLQKGKLDYVGVAMLLFVSYMHIPKDRRKLLGIPPFRIFIPLAWQINIPTTQQPLLIWQLANIWDASYVVVESHGMQTLHEWLEKQRQEDPSLAAEIQPISFGSQSKAERLQSITPLLNPPAGDPPLVYFHPNVVTPEPAPDIITLTDGTQHEILPTFREQILAFPISKNDDVMDAVVQGLKWIHFHLVEYDPDEDDNGGGNNDSAMTMIAM